MALGPVGLVHPEALLGAGYAVLLLLVAFGVERMARRTHRRAEQYQTRGFTYHRHIDAWECPTGQHLLLTQVDAERRLRRYRAHRDTCNRCPLKAGCTDSDAGREIAQSIDVWPHSEVAAFHRGLSQVLIILAGLIAAVALARHHTESEVAVLVPTLLVVMWLASSRARPRLVP